VGGWPTHSRFLRMCGATMFSPDQFRVGPPRLVSERFSRPVLNGQRPFLAVDPHFPYLTTGVGPETTPGPLIWSATSLATTGLRWM